MNTWFSICFLKGIQVSSVIDEQTPQDNGNQQDSDDLHDEISLPTTDNLAEIVQELVDSDPYTKRRIATALMRGAVEQKVGGLNVTKTPYLDRLLKVFNEVERTYEIVLKKRVQDFPPEIFSHVQSAEHNDLIIDKCMDSFIQQQVNNLHSLFQIYRSLLSLNERELLETLMNDHYWTSTFGALEYDPDLFMPANFLSSHEGSPTHLSKSPTHDFEDASMASNRSNLTLMTEHSGSGAFSDAGFREFLQHKVQFKQAVKIDDPVVIECIHLSYRL